MLVETKNLHLPHIEEEILDSGYEGAKAAIQHLEGVTGMLAGNSESGTLITTKWDGSPAIVAGTNPENGKFFVGTKSVFNKTVPKICYTPGDINEMYSGELAEKLRACLKHLPKLNIKGILQGDLMFTEGDVKERKIDGKNHLTFMPNTILYAIPTDSKLGKKIAKAKLGIIFHTGYDGPSIKDLSATHRISVKDLTSTPDVWFDDATYLDASGAVTLTAQETAEAIRHIEAARRALARITKEEFNKITSDKKYVQFLKQYQNQLIRGGELIGDISQWITSLPEFIATKIGKEKVKPETQKKKIEKLHAHAREAEGALRKILEFQKHIIEAKHILIRKLETAKRIGTFRVSDKGLIVAPQEGFVCVDKLGRAVKLVDRLEFSRANFLRREEDGEEGEITAVIGTPSLLSQTSLMSQASYMGGETGLAGKDPVQTPYLGTPTGQFSDSTGTLGSA